MEPSADGAAATMISIPLENAPSGLYTTVIIDSLTVRCLVDSGCNTDIILAAWLFESIPEEEQRELHHPLQTIRQANGSLLNHYGRATMSLSIGNVTRSSTVYVADIEEEAILGLSGLRSLGATIDFHNNVLLLDQQQTPQEEEENLHALKCNRIALPVHLEDLYLRTIKSVAPEHHQKIGELLADFADVFSSGDFDIGNTHAMRHKILTPDNVTPIKQHPYRVSTFQQEEIDRQVNMLLQKNLIEPSSSPWASPVTLVKKKDGKQRFCVDYRKLNECTQKDAYPIPRIDDTLDALSGAHYFSTLDLAAGYWQVPLDDEAKDKSTFCVRGGLYRWKVMPFGLTNAPATFSRLMETIFQGLQYQSLLIYLDDVIVYGNSVDQQIQRLRVVFQRLRQANLKLKPSKCELLQTSVQYLGHTVSSHGVETNPDTVEKIKNFPVPHNLRQVRRFIGLASYYRKFIKDFAAIAQPLHLLMKKDVRFRWSEECDQAFQHLKTCLTTAPVLAYPQPTGDYVLDTDASAYGIGAVLHQVQDGEEKVIAYASKALSHAEQQYCTTRRELLAIVAFLKHFRHYLYGRKVLVRTDHGSLQWLINFKSPTGQLARWLEQVTEYDLKIVYRPGRKHDNADTLSRLDSCKQCGREDSCIRHETPVKVRLITIEPDWTLATIQEAQRKDTALQKLYACKADKLPRPDRNEISGYSRAAKHYFGLWDQLEIRDGVLCKRWESDEGSILRWLIVIPDQFVEKVLHECHSAPTGGHQGVNKTMGRIRRQFTWYGMTADIRSWIRQCDLCSRRKLAAKRHCAELVQLKPGEPMQIVAMDILGPLPESTSGNRYILVIGEYFTKWVEAFAIPDQETATIAQCLVDQFICRFSVPHQLHSDQGRNFEAFVIKDICQLLGIEKTRTTPYHPQSDGFVERFNRTMMDMVSKLIEPARRQRDWDEKLQTAMFAYRSTPQTSTGESPNMMMLGREANMPIDLQMEQPLPDVHDPLTTDYAKELRNKLSFAHERARKHLQQSAVRQKSHHDQKTKGGKIDKGMFVWLAKKATKKGMSPKLDMKWHGPFLVIDKLSDVVFRIQQNGPRGTKKVVHYDLLKPYCGKPLTSWLHKLKPVENHEEPPSLMTDDSPTSSQSEQSTLHDQQKKSPSRKLETEASQPEGSENRYPERHRKPPDRYQ